MNVLEYYQAKLDQDCVDTDGNWEDMPLDSVCGEACKSAIDAAVEFIRHLNDAFGKYADLHIQEVRDMTDNIINCYICG